MISYLKEMKTITSNNNPYEPVCGILSLLDISLFVRPYPFDPEEPNVIIQKERNILEQEIPSIELNKVMENLKERKYASKEDYAIAIN